MGGAFSRDGSPKFNTSWIPGVNRHILAPSMWWILPIPLAEQRHKLPKISPDHRSDEQVAKWTEARPVGVVGLYVDDILAGTNKNICQGLMNWI
eukprot:148572-Amphidinium_carterae.1